jgi:hypothetical protein
MNATWQHRVGRSTYFIGALLLHLVLFLLIATFVVFKSPVKEETAAFRQFAIPPPPPPAPPAPSGGDAVNNLEPDVQVTPPPTAPSMISTVNPSAFTVKAVKVALPNLPASMTTPTGSGLSGASAPGPGSGAGAGSNASPFGSETSTGSVQFQGYLYDLKQTADLKPTGLVPGTYHNKLTQFVKANWNPSFLAQYYKSPTALNTSSIFIPTLSAMDGPKVFGVADKVQPNMYVIWYKTKAAPTQDGTYHFVGVADDILVVRVDGRTVLDGCLYPVDAGLRANETTYPLLNFRASCPPDNKLYVGAPFHVSAGQAVDIDVLIGEEPGGYSNYFLYMQRDESTYQPQSNGAPLLPVFQLDSNPIHPQGKPSTYPAFSKDLEPWGAGSN